MKCEPLMGNNFAETIEYDMFHLYPLIFTGIVWLQAAKNTPRHSSERK